MPTTPDVTEVWERAHKEQVTEPESAKASFLLNSIGPRIAAAALGQSDARPLKSWARGDVAGGPRDHMVATRLDALYHVVRAISEIYSAGVAARYLRSSDPQLDDVAPLVVLSGAQNAGDVRRVLVAARAFLES